MTGQSHVDISLSSNRQLMRALFLYPDNVMNKVFM